jgi:hypothetical protein
MVHWRELENHRDDACPRSRNHPERGTKRNFPFGADPASYIGTPLPRSHLALRESEGNSYKIPDVCHIFC